MAKKKSNIDNESLDTFLTRIYGEGIVATADKALPLSKRDVLNTPLSLDIALSGGIPDGTICLITGKPKSGKCVDSKKTFAITNKGVLSLEELKILSGIKVVSHTGTIKAVSSWYNNGIAKVIKIRTRLGLEIGVTPDHPLMTLDHNGCQQWKNGRDIAVGDVLLCRRSDNLWGDRLLGYDDAYMCGLLVGKGNVVPNRIHLLTQEYTCHKKEFYIDGHKQIPRFIRECNINSICSALSGYFDADGIVDEKKISVITHSEILSTQIKTILMNLGILSGTRIGHIVPRGKTVSSRYWEIIIQNIESIKIFRDCVNFRAPRKRRALKLLCQGKTSTSCDTIPYLKEPIIALQEEIITHRGYFLPQTMDNLIVSIKSLKTGDREGCRNVIQKMLDQLIDYKHLKEYKKIQLLMDPHLFFDRIVSLDSDRVHTSDLSVPMEKSFLANGIINHNTTICLELLRNAQILDRPTFYIDIEKRCTPALLSTIKGLDPSKLQVIPHKIDKPLTAEDYLNIIERISKTQKKAVVVIDSIAALSTMTEQEEQIGSNKDMAGPAKLLSAFFRRAQQVVNSNDVILIFISQMMTNREPRGPKWMEKGGIAIQYACSVWLKVTWTQQWERNVETNAPDGHDMHITVQSSALGRPLLPCILPLRYGAGIDAVKDIVMAAENLGLIEKAGAWYSIPFFAKKDEDTPKFQGLARLSNFLKDNPGKLKKLEAEIRSIVLPIITEKCIDDSDKKDK